MRRDSNAHTLLRRRGLGTLRVPPGASIRHITMPGTKTRTPETITAAAQVLAAQTVDRTIKRPPAEQWQGEAWDLRDEIGELRFIGDRQARGVSQVRLFIGKAEGDDATPTPTDDPLGIDLQAILFGSRAATEQFLNRAAQHLIFNGDSIFHATQDGGRIAITARATQELQGRPGDWTFSDGVTSPQPVGTDELVIRCWRPHPRWYGKADAPVRAIMPVARELRGLTQFVSALVDSRLAGAGLLLVPDQIESMWKAGRDDAEEMTFAEELTEYLLTPIKDRDSAASVVPFMATLPADLIDKVKHLSFASPLDEHAAKLRDESIRRIGLGMDSDPSILLGQASGNHWCMDTESEVYTRRGWVNAETIEIGDECLSLDHSTGLSVWKPVVDLYRADVIDEPMLSIEGYFHSSLTTMDHRWPVERRRWDRAVTWEREWATSRELAYLAENGKSPKLPMKITRGAVHANLPLTAKYDDALVELVAWYFTEGTKGERPGRRTPTVGIYQSEAVNPENCVRIRRALSALFGPASESLDKGGRYATAETVERCAKARELRAQGMPVAAIAAEVGVSKPQVSKYLKQDPKVQDSTPRWREIRRTGASEGMLLFKLNAAAAEVIVEHAPGRIVSTSFIDELTHAQLLLFVDTAVRGDGHARGTSRNFGQKDPAMLEAFERACFLLGYPTSRSIRDGKHRFGGDQHVLNVSENGTGYCPNKNTMEIRNYTGTVWCPTIADTNTMLMRRNGFVSYTGNSAWAVDANEVRFGIEPVAAIICHALTVGLLRPLLEQRGVTDVERWQVWYDVSSIVVRDDRSKDAQTLFDKGLLSADSVRAENGFSASDAPNPAETEQDRWWKLAQARPDLLEQILPKLGMTLDETDTPPDAGDDFDPAAVVDEGAGVAEEAPDGPPVMGETEATQ